MASIPDHPNDSGTWTRLEGRRVSPSGAASVRRWRLSRCTMSSRLRGRARSSTTKPRPALASTNSLVGRAKERMAQQSARRDQENQGIPPRLEHALGDLDRIRELPYRPATVSRRTTGRTDGSIRLRVRHSRIHSCAEGGVHRWLADIGPASLPVSFLHRQPGCGVSSFPDARAWGLILSLPSRHVAKSARIRGRRAPRGSSRWRRLSATRPPSRRKCVRSPAAVPMPRGHGSGFRSARSAPVLPAAESRR
jgi:hypothetical protein